MCVCVCVCVWCCVLVLTLGVFLWLIQNRNRKAKTFIHVIWTCLDRKGHYDNTFHGVWGFVVFKALPHTLFMVSLWGRRSRAYHFPFKDDVTEMQRGRVSFLKAVMAANPDTLTLGCFLLHHLIWVMSSFLPRTTQVVESCNKSKKSSPLFSTG